MQKNRKFLLSSFVVSLLLSNIAMAQYIWLNDKGVKQYSDTPPPKSVPRDKIIKTPAGAVRGAAGQNTNPETKTDSDKLEKPVTLASKNEEFNKRKLAREESEKKASSEAQQAQEKSKNCERAKTYKQSIEEGMLITTRNKDGERVTLDEAQRAKELTEVKKTLADCK